MRRIDAHCHFNGNHPASAKFCDDLNVKILSICIGTDTNGAWRTQADRYGAMTQKYPEQYAWITSFDLPRFDDRGYVDKVINQLDRDFAAGAIACKVWKNLGMEVKHPDGRWFQVDDPLLSPIFDYLAKSNKTLAMHIGEPMACWRPLDKTSPHYGYYSVNPQWHMYGKSEWLSHADHIKARDNVAAQHPTLRIVGCHFGSLEYDTDEVAKRLDQYPNFAVDTSARLGDMMIQDREKVRNFFLKYQDRILFGTDLFTHADVPSPTDEQRAQIHKDVKECALAWFDFLGTDKVVSYWDHSAKGLALPPDVCEKIWLHNAKHWYPGI